MQDHDIIIKNHFWFEMATVCMLDHVDRFFGVPTGLFCIDCFQQSWEPERPRVLVLA